MIKTSLTALLALSLVGCFSFEEKTQEPTQSLGERDIKYYSNKTVSSLEIPPDLTKPSLQNAFKETQLRFLCICVCSIQTKIIMLK